MKSSDGVVYLIEIVEVMCHQLINIKLLSHHLLLELWNFCPTFPSTESSSLPDSASDKLEWSCAYFMTSGCDSNHATLAPTSVCELQCVSHDSSIASAVKSIIVTPWMLLHQLLFAFISTCVVFWVHAVCCSQCLGNWELASIEVNTSN